MGFEGVKERKKKKSEKKKGDVENQKRQKVQKSEISILFFKHFIIKAHARMLRSACNRILTSNPQLLRVMSTSATSGVWKHHKVVPDTPEGFTMRGTVPTDENGVDVMMEKWDAGSSEPPHSHPGDDMTVVIEGKMSVQFFKKEGDKLVEDGEPLILNKGDAGYIDGGRIHDAKYLEDCKLVYVHDKKFGFDAAASA
tara:strand:- start:3536 stop:4126 length:591 start_codon:yes stop_codon:yes gene_type:complete